MKLTTSELAIIGVIKDNMEVYGDGFSDITVDNMVAETIMDVKQVKGVLSSLSKKELVNFGDEVYSLTQKGFDAIGFMPEYYEDLMQ